MSFSQQFFVPTEDMKAKLNLKQQLQPVDFTILSSSFSIDKEKKSVTTEEVLTDNLVEAEPEAHDYLSLKV